MFINKLVNCAFILLLLLLYTPLAAPAATGPKAQVPETTFDFGEVFEDLKLTHTFEIKNIGDVLLEIKDIDSDCALPQPPPTREGELLRPTFCKVSVGCDTRGCFVIGP